MAGKYRSVHWNRQKRLYDFVLAAMVLTSLLLIVGLSAWLRPELTIETLLMRATAFIAILLLHVVLAIGPAARLNARLLPLLYNRRHLGVSLFVLALAHATLAIVQYHAAGDQNPLASIFTAYQHSYDPFTGARARLSDFPFEPFGVFALLVLFLMAATSHDFWLRNLGASIWKALHIGVYLAYGAVLVHVAYGFLQSETSKVYPILLGLGFVALSALHLAAQRRERRIDRRRAVAERDGFLRACASNELREGRGKVVRVGAQRVAIYLHQSRVFALSNVCRHQGGPIGEGRIRDGCVTCPWHGWQYKPENGTSPPPFHEVVPTYGVCVVDGEVFVHPAALPLGTENSGAALSSEALDREVPGPDQEFYIGYLKQSPKRIAKLTRRVTIGLSALSLIVGATLVTAQRPQPSGRFEFGTVRDFQGVLYETPVPTLYARVEAVTGNKAASHFVLVNSGKRGLPSYARNHHGQKVRFRGTLVYHENHTMIEMNDPRSFQVIGPAAPEEQRGQSVALGEFELTGELVDTKCYFGVMRPATGKVHRACAINCLRGGVPPGILVRDEYGDAVVVLLAGNDASPLDYDPEWAALPVTARGLLEIHDDMPVLRVAHLKLADRR
ncbi:MAG: Rieske 2Fe-2S domain-containing protein [Planctomycetota bacterium]